MSEVTTADSGNSRRSAVRLVAITGLTNRSAQRQKLKNCVDVRKETFCLTVAILDWALCNSFVTDRHVPCVTGCPLQHREVLFAPGLSLSAIASSVAKFFLMDIAEHVSFTSPSHESILAL